MKPRTIVGIIFLIMGLGLFGSGGMILAQALDRQAADDARITRSEVACREQIVQLGRVTPLENNEVEIEITDPDNENGIEDPRSALADATAALAMCPGREIIEACLGTMCGTATPGPIRMTIRLGVIE